MTRHPLAGKPVAHERLIDVGLVRDEYYARKPDMTDRAQRVRFGASGHRGSSLAGAFNEAHVLAITQAICDYRRKQGVTGPVYIGKDTHALSGPAFATALEVLTANGVDTMVDSVDAYTPTPAISRAILRHNLGRPLHLADGIVLTPSNNPPQDGGIKYSAPHGGPAGTEVTRWIEDKANRLLTNELRYVPRVAYERARHAPTTHTYDYIAHYVNDLPSVVDMEVIRSSRVKIGVDPLGGAATAVWGPIVEQYGVDVKLVNDAVDPTFRFIPLDWDGEIRMDCSSPQVMAALIDRKDGFDIACGNNPDADRQGIVTAGAGLMGVHQYLPAAISYLFAHRPDWRRDVAVGKTVVSSSLIDRVAARLGRALVEVPPGFKWFVPGLLAGSLGLGGEETAGAAFLRRDGSVWTTDKDGIVMALLAIELTARMGRDPSELYAELTSELGAPLYERTRAPATPEEKAVLQTLSPADVKAATLAGDPIVSMLTAAPGNGAAIGGLKIVTANGWFAACPSKRDAVYKLYAESFRGRDHLHRIQEEGQALVNRTLARIMS